MKAIKVAGVLGAMLSVLTQVVGAATVERTLSAGPERVWTAVLGSGVPVLAVDHERFEATIVLDDAMPVSVSVDWDEADGGSRLAGTGESADSEGFRRWVEGVERVALEQVQRNRYCRGLRPDPRHDEVPEPSLEAATDCGLSTGNFSSALLELEKCGDHETTLKLLSLCSHQNHAGGLVRISQLYEIGAAVPRRAERAAHFLARAASADNTEYHISAKTLYATALYFGVGVPVDRPRALALFQTAASLGDSAAGEFLRTGTHAAWRRIDGSLFRDPDFVELRR